MVYPALLPLMHAPRLPVVERTDAPADLNGLVRFAERPNLVSARVPSHFNWASTRKIGRTPLSSNLFYWMCLSSIYSFTHQHYLWTVFCTYNISADLKLVTVGGTPSLKFYFYYTWLDITSKILLLKTVPFWYTMNVFFHFFYFYVFFPLLLYSHTTIHIWPLCLHFCTRS